MDSETVPNGKARTWIALANSICNCNSTATVQHSYNPHKTYKAKTIHSLKSSSISHWYCVTDCSLPDKTMAFVGVWMYQRNSDVKCNKIYDISNVSAQGMNAKNKTPPSWST